VRAQYRSHALVAAWLDFLTPAQRALALVLQTAVLEGAPEAQQIVRSGKLVFAVEGELMLALSAHKTHLNLQFFQGECLPAELGPLDSAKRGQRNWRCPLGQATDAVRVAMLVAAAAQLARAQAARRPPPDRDRPDLAEG
jgi:hypothetical protein